jgi:hypothetical protein
VTKLRDKNCSTYGVGGFAAAAIASLCASVRVSASPKSSFAFSDVRTHESSSAELMLLFMLSLHKVTLLLLVSILKTEVPTASNTDIFPEVLVSLPRVPTDVPIGADVPPGVLIALRNRTVLVLVIHPIAHSLFNISAIFSIF